MAADALTPAPSAARALLGALADVAAGGASSASAPPGIAAWLAAHDLAALGRAAFGPGDPVLASALAAEALGAAASNAVHLATARTIEGQFEADGIGMVLLKGAAIAPSAYADASLRPMTDVDVWVRDDEMSRAVSALGTLGFRQVAGLESRPPALQRRSGGELVFRAERGPGLVELHFSPFPGWWIARTASPDLEGLWSRSVPVGAGRHARRLAADDACLQTAFHVVVNQFGQAPLRGLMDLAVLARAFSIDWSAVVARARAYRLTHATWIALDIAERLIGVPGAAAAIAALRPPRPRRIALRAFATPRSVLARRDLTRASRRHPFMLVLVERRRDAARLVGRTVWPESWWIEARHGHASRRLRHLGGLLRGEV
ncbi:MAG TPA: nucleotidyltransferase family protein [Candidatus Polarisedimenticolaceae bacterium]|nr:nucleotidyltransferase family protein [Candidatus Polarisedimenticolaceae bacterium]